MIDGTSNSVIETDVVPLEAPTGSDGNWAGNGFVTKKTIISSTDAGGRLYDAEKGRMWSFVNEDKLHYSSKLPVGFKVRFILSDDRSGDLDTDLSVVRSRRSCAKISLPSSLSPTRSSHDEPPSLRKICLSLPTSKDSSTPPVNTSRKLERRRRILSPRNGWLETSRPRKLIS